MADLTFNGSIGGFRPAQMVATAQPISTGAVMPAPLIPIAPPIIVVPEAISEIYASTELPGYPPRLLLRPTIVSQWRSGGGDIHRITFRLRAGRPIDLISLMLANVPQQATIYASAGPTRANAESGSPAFTTGAAVPFWASSQPDRDVGDLRGYHSLLRLPQPQTYEWWSLVISNAPSMRATALVAGRQRIAAKNYNRDASEGVEDLGRFEYNADGGASSRRGVRMRTATFELVWMDEAQYNLLFKPLLFLLGSTSPVFVLPNSAPSPYLHDRMLYGILRGSQDASHQTSKFYSKSFDMLSLT